MYMYYLHSLTHSLTQAFMLFEDEITDTKAQTSAITLIAGTLENIRTFTEDSFNPLSTKYACMRFNTCLKQSPNKF